MDSPEFLMRVSTDPAFGAGHLARMQALRPHLNAPVKWFVDPGTSLKVRHLIPLEDEILEEPSNTSVTKLLFWQKHNTAKMIICDSYQIPSTELSLLGVKILFFCDDDTESWSANVTIVNCQPGATPRTNCLSGPYYMPINTRERQQQKVNFDNFDEPINCLINFGTVDTKNLTALALEALLSTNSLSTRIRPICLVGPHFQHKKVIDPLLNSFPGAKRITKCNSVLDIPFECPLAIGAPGLSHAERLFQGTATVLVPQNGKHQILSERWQVEGCGVSASTEISDIVSQLQFLMANGFHEARSISLRGQEVIDGKGAIRIAKKILIETNIEND